MSLNKRKPPVSVMTMKTVAAAHADARRRTMIFTASCSGETADFLLRGINRCYA